MKTHIYKFKFKTEVHFGDGSLAGTASSFHADTLFSALCFEAIKMGRLDEFVNLCFNHKLSFSDAFPFKKDRLYLPKPLVSRKRDPDAVPSELDVANRKKLKKLHYIAVDLFQDYLNGKDIFEKNDLSDFGKASSRSKNCIRSDGEDVEPYHVGTFRFNEDCGLYVIARYEDDSILPLTDELFTSLSYSGIGGKRTSGYGKFDVKSVKADQSIFPLLNSFGKVSANPNAYQMLLCAAYPEESQINEVLLNSHISVIRRSGFVAGESGEEELLKKKDSYVFDCGSCFKQRFEGVIFDVSRGTPHKVYRYALPMFMEIELG